MAADDREQGGRDVRRLRSLLTWPAWACCLCLLLLYPLFPRAFQRAEFYPFLLGMAVLGLPHGAMDHLAAPHLLNRPLTVRYLLLFLVGYGLLVLLYLCLWHAAPAAAFLLFLLFSWLHWGQGDYYFLRVFNGRPAPSTTAGRLLIWGIRGALPILLPALAFPAVFAQVAAGVTGWYHPRGVDWTLSRSVVDGGLLLLAALTALYLWAAWREYGCERRAWFWLDAFEIGLLAALFWNVPPILAVGVYFCVWHAARHIARLMLLDPVAARQLAQGYIGRSLLRTAVQSLPLTLAALALLGFLEHRQAQSPVSLAQFIYLYLSLIAALTFPHFLLVLWMDRRQHVDADYTATAPERKRIS